MEHRVKKWYEAINVRGSRRRYQSTRIKDTSLERIRAVAEDLREEAGSARAAVVESHDGSVFSGLRGGYGVIQGAPSYIAFLADTSDPASFEKLGFLGEGVVLEATRLELGTCWVSGTFDSSAVGRDFDLLPGEKVIAVSPLGYPEEKHAFSEKIMSGFAGSRRRKPLEQLIAGSEPNQWPHWAKTAAEAARLAPSALNRQPWLFRFDGSSFTIEVAGGSSRSGVDTGKRLDCGIALRHAATGAEYALGEPATVEFLDPPLVARVWPR